MKKTKIILLLTIPLILFIALYPIFSVNDTNRSAVNESQNGTANASSPEKVAFIIPHPDDETIGVGEQSKESWKTVLRFIASL
ncbi:hypothetical protein [Methanobacterium subterraneum]|uniref:hypothetical protein n=1 Tax=Methanobacterium subterraneum TaxID=59277 RepID=UPI001F33E367|nr:hypothetical protein [Methanobacterium subterraneum]